MQKLLFLLIAALLYAGSAGAQKSAKVDTAGVTAGAEAGAQAAQASEYPCPSFIVTMHPDGDQANAPVTFRFRKMTLVCGEYCEGGAEQIVKAWQSDFGDGIIVRYLQTATHLYSFTFARKNHNGLTVKDNQTGDIVALFGS